MKKTIDEIFYTDVQSKTLKELESCSTEELMQYFENIIQLYFIYGEKWKTPVVWVSRHSKQIKQAMKIGIIKRTSGGVVEVTQEWKEIFKYIML